MIAGALDVFQGRKVFLTGHTGFKGAWLTLVLQELGAEVFGYALAPESGESLFSLCGLDRTADGVFADIRDTATLQAAMQGFSPDLVVHMAAQSLVRRGHAEPVATFDVNLMGTISVMQAVRALKTPPVLAVITTDKVYENAETGRLFAEGDPLGGKDPYSASKAAAEIAVAAWWESYLRDGGVRLAVLRAGNVIGGGDISQDRLLPDLLAAFAQGRPALVRSPASVRPWQHVLDALDGYLTILARLMASPEPRRLVYNIGPEVGTGITVRQLAEQAAARWGEGARLEFATRAEGPAEAGVLQLDSARLRLDLGWRERLDAPRAVEWTVDWARARSEGAEMKAFTRAQIAAYRAAGAEPQGAFSD